MTILSMVSALVLAFSASASWASNKNVIPNLSSSSSAGTLKVESLSDSLIRFTYSPGNSSRTSDLKNAVPTPMIAQTVFPGPSRSSVNEYDLRTPNYHVAIEINSAQAICASVYQKSNEGDGGNDSLVTHFCPTGTASSGAGLSIWSPTTESVYGLGQEFSDLTQLSWLGKRRSPGTHDGNLFQPFHGGAVGNTQLPILYALGKGKQGYAIFVDGLTAQNWDFSTDPWKLNTYEKTLTWYWIAGEDLPALRSQYMDLVGRAPVPPKKYFGLWVSQYGFRSWDELDDKLSTLRKNRFPIDGFVMDLQWFGGVKFLSGHTHMGTLKWDESHFPAPADKIHSLLEKDGIGLTLIEESYVGYALKEHQDLADRGFLVMNSNRWFPIFLYSNPWWGVGGMIDWTNDDAGDFWHDVKRQPLIDMGVLGHWTDLGEPEMFSEAAWYHGLGDQHSDLAVHNLYNLKWTESIARGYQRHALPQRHFVLSRSGTTGSQRFGAALWSADIGSNQPSLKAQFRTQANVSLSGIDYFGSDIGGFHREALDGDLNELYTQWFADSSLFDIPVRPHTDNQCNCRQTAPDRVGDLESNLENIRLRYRLIPYYYSLAHRAYEKGGMIVAPLVYGFQADETAREIPDEKMIGDGLLAAAVSGYAQTKRDVYLPAGTWFDFRSGGTPIVSSGQWFRNVPTRFDGKVALPLYAREGAIIPMADVTPNTMNSEGQSLNGDSIAHPELPLRVYGSTHASQFTWIEDDGKTEAYQNGEARRTVISQSLDQSGAHVALAASEGTFQGASDLRSMRLEYWGLGVPARQVQINGSQVPLCVGENRNNGDKAACWKQGADGQVVLNTSLLGVNGPLEIEIEK